MKPQEQEALMQMLTGAFAQLDKALYVTTDYSDAAYKAGNTQEQHALEVLYTHAHDARRKVIQAVAVLDEIRKTMKGESYE